MGRQKQDNDGACAWVKEHLNHQQQSGMKKGQVVEEAMGSGNSKEKKKYLIADWHSSVGFEFPAVIFVTRDLNDDRNATFCQRAKAKLVIYHAIHSNNDKYTNII